MSLEILLFLLILFGGFALLATEAVALEVVAFVVLLALVFSGLLPANEAFDSFGNQSIFLIGSLFILIAGLRKTGIVSRLEDIIGLFSNRPRWMTFSVVLLVVALISAFVSNTATLAVCIPLVVRLAKKYNESSRSWLMPVAFASVLGGMNSLIGTSTNIIISSLLPAYSIREFDLFTTAYVGFPILLVGLLYLVLFSGMILRREGDQPGDDLEVKYDLRSYTAEIVVQAKSPVANKTLSSTALFKEADVTVLNIIREGAPTLYPHSGFLIREKDRLLVEGNISKLTEITDKYGLTFREEAKVKELQDNKKKNNIEIEFHEVLISSDSMLVNRKPAGISLRNRFGISLIAINRKGETLRSKLSDLRMEPGDILVVQFLAPADNDLLDYLGLVPLQKIAQQRLLSNKAWLAAGIFIGALLLGSLSAYPLSITCLAGAMSLPILRILKMNEVYAALEWRILLFIGAILSLGKAMVSSGAADYLAGIIGTALTGLDPAVGLAFFFAITVVMTSLLSNQATAVVMVPLAVNTAQSLGLDPMPFVMAVTAAASCCFLTPFEPAFMLVYGPGGYKFHDFFKLGILLNIFAMLVAATVIPLMWSF